METNSRTTIAIIGSAGRKDDASKVNRNLYDSMILEAERIITKEWEFEWKNVELVSGGASFSDHGNLISSFCFTIVSCCKFIQKTS